MRQELGNPGESRPELEKQRDQLKIEMEGFDNMSEFLGHVNMQDEQKADCQLVSKKIHDRRPLGLRIKCALRDLAEYHRTCTKQHGKTRSVIMNSKKEAGGGRKTEADELEHVHEQGV